MTVDAPTSMSAQMGAVQTERRETGMPTPLVGMLLFIASEVMFFGGLFAAYFNARASFVGEWGPAHPAEPLELMPIALPITIILISSSVTMQFGVWAIRRGDQRAMRFWTAVTLILGVIFLIGQVYDYSVLGFGVGDGVFGTVFYTLTGFHGAHVFGGTVGLTILVARASQGQFSARNHVAVEAVSIYWHFVDVVWIALFTTLYFLR
ncbi:MAG TPA: cytochrome c oxidase subunit 3 [Candidatus Limnocylindria bacterium]|jgi:cytochrome c oxidase subunit 3|nr:cytochrome c oxidase subunit 3 [Candidatus Limnocylindria bacterium]